MFKDFMEFLKQYGVIGLAIAVVIGGKLNELVTAVVNGLLMPIVSVVLPSGNWREAVLSIGPVKLLPGLILGSLIDFMIVAWIVFMFAKKVLKEEKVAKK